MSRPQIFSTLFALVIAAWVIFLVGCSDSPKIEEEIRYKKVIPEKKKAEASEWILRAIKAANPMSDEEPEDNIRQAENTALNLFGETTIGLLVGKRHYWHFIPYEKCNERQRAICDAFLEGQDKGDDDGG